MLKIGSMTNTDGGQGFVAQNSSLTVKSLKSQKGTGIRKVLEKTKLVAKKPVPAKKPVAKPVAKVEEQTSSQTVKVLEDTKKALATLFDHEDAKEFLDGNFDISENEAKEILKHATVKEMKEEIT